jgi:DNA-binding GntR family transcriptional regulator
MSTFAGLEINDLYTSRPTAHEMVRDALRVAILSGRLAWGARLVQADIASELRVSTTPVREALRDLAAEGLIRFDPHRGAVVCELDINDFKEIYQIRRVIEPLAIRLAAERITKEELDKADELQRQLDQEEDSAAWVKGNWQFHALLDLGAHSPRLAVVVTSMHNSAALYVSHSVNLNPKRIHEGNAEHRAILVALRAGDADQAAEAFLQHLDRTWDSMVQADGSRGGLA